MKKLSLKIINTYRIYGLLGLFIRILRFPFYQLVRKNTHKKIFSNINTKSIFTDIYKYNWWGSKESLSGTGSTIENTELLRNNLTILFNNKKIKNLFDAPCGDFNWMQLFLNNNNNNIYYLGWDIVDELIKNNRKLYQNEFINFQSKSIISDTMPNYDIWLCRDCFIHFSYYDIFKTLTNFSNSNIPLILFSTYSNHNDFENYDIKTGDARVLDFFKFPFNFKQNYLDIIIDDTDAGIQKNLVLFSRQAIIENLKLFQTNIDCCTNKKI